MFHPFAKTIIASYFLSSFIIYSAIKLTEFLLNFTQGDMYTFISLILVLGYMLVVWPLLQTKLFLVFARKFTLFFLPGGLFYFMSVFGLEFTLLLGLYFSGNLVGTPEFNTQWGKFLYTIYFDSLIQVIVLFFVIFSLYVPLVYFSVEKTKKV